MVVASRRPVGLVVEERRVTWVADEIGQIGPGFGQVVRVRRRGIEDQHHRAGCEGRLELARHLADDIVRQRQHDDPGPPDAFSGGHGPDARFGKPRDAELPDLDRADIVARVD